MDFPLLTMDRRHFFGGACNVRRCKDRSSPGPEPLLGSKDISSSSLGGGFKYFLFSSLFGEMIQFDEHIFHMG